MSAFCLHLSDKRVCWWTSLENRFMHDCMGAISKSCWRLTAVSPFKARWWRHSRHHAVRIPPSVLLQVGSPLSCLLSSSSLFPTRINIINPPAASCSKQISAVRHYRSVQHSQVGQQARMTCLISWRKPGLLLVSPRTSSNKALFVCALREMDVLTVSQNPIRQPILLRKSNKM